MSTTTRRLGAQWSCTVLLAIMAISATLAGQYTPPPTAPSSMPAATKVAAGTAFSESQGITPVAGTMAGDDVYCYSPHSCGWPHKTIFINNQASKYWLISNTPAIWRSGTTLHLNNGPCRAGFPCIVVKSVRSIPRVCDPNAKLIGCTVNQYQNRHIVSSTIYMNDSYLYVSWNERMQTACHEIGHALGLWLKWEKTVRNSCMYPWINGQFRSSAADDRYALNQKIYRTTGW